MTAGTVALVIIAALPYADRALDKLAAGLKDKRAKEHPAPPRPPKGTQQ